MPLQFANLTPTIGGFGLRRPRKQRHTAKRILVRLRDEYGFDGGYTTVKDYVSPNPPMGGVKAGQIGMREPTRERALAPLGPM